MLSHVAWLALLLFRANQIQSYALPHLEREWRCTFLGFFATCRGIPWHHLRQIFHDNHGILFTDLHGIP